MIRVVIASDTRFYRDGLRDALDRQHDMRVVGEAFRARDLCGVVWRLRPEVVLLDVGIEGSLPSVRRLLADIPATKVVALGVPDREREVVDCAEAGVAGYVTRDDSLDDLFHSIRSVVRDEMRCSARMAGVLLRRVRALAAERSAQLTLGLTRRELEIIVLIDRGLSNKQIAQQLHIELATVKNHVHNIFEKLGVHRRADAVIRARVEGLRVLN